MQKWFVIALLSAATIAFVSFTQQEENMNADKLRKLYSQSPDKWPAPFIDAGVQWTELGPLPESPLEKHKDSLRNMIELGKKLFFDTRLSGSGKISCATCHQPELNWTDGREKSIGHNGAITKRNSPTIQNSWFYNRLFWDGRSANLQDQAFGPINSETEMHSEMPDVMRMLRRNEQYRQLFRQAFGYDDIGPDELTKAIATFEKTITSGKTKFDTFAAGNTKALNNSELRGLHLFRTKARCMNCHNGPLFSDNQFHGNGFFYEGSPGFDPGLYNVTHKEEDRGKFKTPSLRDVAQTAPYLHDGSIKDLTSILVIYGKGGVARQDQLIKKTDLDKWEIRDLKAFLHAISAPPVAFQKPELP